LALRPGNIGLMIRSLVALPLLVMLTNLAPDLAEKDLARFPIEQLHENIPRRSINEVIGAETKEWQAPKLYTIFDLTVHDHEIWRRIRIPATHTARSQTFVADGGTLFFPEVDFYLVRDGQIIDRKLTGMDRPIQPGAKKHARSTFQFEQKTGENLTLYVRHASNFFYVRPLALHTLERDLYLSWLKKIAIGLVVGFLIGFVINNVAIAIQMRQKMYADYALFLLTTLLMAMSFNGTFVEFFDHFDFDTWMRTTLLLCFVIIAAYLNFVDSFLNAKRNFPRLHRILSLVLKTSALTLPSVFLIKPGISFVLLVCVVIGIAIFTIALCLPRIHIPEVSRFFIAVSGVLIGAIVQIVSAPRTYTSLLGMDGVFLIGAAWGALFLSAAMAKQVDTQTTKSQVLREAVTKNIPVTELNAYRDDTFAGQFAPSKMYVTIMFVDTASFSRIAESVDARTLFNELSMRLEEITRIIIDHGGTVDRSLGDGILCFFGYESGLINSRNHVGQAFEAALKIQENYVNSIYDTLTTETPRIPLPIRIGIHTDSVTIGNMGSSIHIDFTMVGNGVNFANRLETACAQNRIMVSQDVYRELKAQRYDVADFNQTLIAIKHQVELVPAYEINPHKNRMDKLAVVNRHFLDRMGDQVRDVRHVVNTGVQLTARSLYGDLIISDFSRRGFLLRGANFLAQKSHLTIELRSSIDAINQKLADRMLTTIEVEVRWSRRSGDGYDHGVQVVGGHPDQWDFLYQTLRSFTAATDDMVA